MSAAESQSMEEEVDYWIRSGMIHISMEYDGNTLWFNEEQVYFLVNKLKDAERLEET